MQKKAQRRLRALPCQDREKLSQHQGSIRREGQAQSQPGQPQNLEVQNTVGCGKISLGERRATCCPRGRTGPILGALGGQESWSSLWESKSCCGEHT